MLIFFLKLFLELLEKCHPLGMFDAMSALTTMHNVTDMYNSAIVDTPLGMLLYVQIYINIS